jgi:hypothetical protein
MTGVISLNKQGFYPVEHLASARVSTTDSPPVHHEQCKANTSLLVTQSRLGRSRFELSNRKISAMRSPTNTCPAHYKDDRINFKQDGKQYFFQIEGDCENSPKRLAFEDNNSEIVASSDDKHAARRMVELAIEKGWKPIQVQGTDAFKEAVREAAKELKVSVNEKPLPQLNYGVALTKADLAKVENAKANKLINGAVFSGHGVFKNDGETIVPTGTSITFYAEHGAKISDELGNMIEEHKDVSGFYKKTFKAGDRIPNYMLLPPKDLDVKGDPITVDKPTRLSNLLIPNMGTVSWAACTYDPTSENSKKEFHVSGILNSKSNQYITRYD